MLNKYLFPKSLHNALILQKSIQGKIGINMKQLFFMRRQGRSLEKMKFLYQFFPVANKGNPNVISSAAKIFSDRKLRAFFIFIRTVSRFWQYHILISATCRKKIPTKYARVAKPPDFIIFTYLPTDHVRRAAIKQYCNY